jgi:3',5'-cyclic AMP phosphodiesterase CpdA
VSAPLLIAQLSDPHIGGTWGAGDPVAGLASAVAAVRALDPAPAAVVVTGDLADHGADSEYEQLLGLLEPLEVPVHLLVGNHDDRAALRRHVDLPGEGDEPLQYAVQIGPLRIVALDSMRAGGDSGELDGPRLSWLDASLAAAPDLPTLLAVHHHPAPIGLPAFDAIGIPARDRAALAEVLAGRPQVRAVVAGHVHRASVGVIADRPAIIAPSTYAQAMLDFAADRFAFGDDPPAFAVHALVDGALASHVVRAADV